MPTMKPLPQFFGEEWDRFVKGVQGLDPTAPRLTPQQIAYYTAHPDAPGQINIPGWDQIIKLGPKAATTKEDWQEYYRASRAGQAPNLSREKMEAIQYASGIAEAMRASQLPGWAQSYGSIMTAIDNVQDFVSTVATLGRLSIWGFTHLGNYFFPGASAEVAAALARAAAEKAAATTAAELAALKITDAAFIQAASRAAYARAFRSAMLGLGARIGLRAVPVVGWILLASDLLNLVNLLLMTAFPAYALLCDGPSAALAAGVPAIVLKNVLCQRVWANATVNPFSRAARASRLLKAAGKLPSIANLIEVAQTTDNLFGYGLSIGAIYGMIMEALFSATGAGMRPTTQLNFDNVVRSLGSPGVERLSSMPAPQQFVYQQASRTLQSAMILQSVSDTLPDELHLLTVSASIAATSVLYDFFTSWDSEPLVAAMIERKWSAPEYLSPSALGAGDDEVSARISGGRWPAPGAPRELSGNDLVQHFGPRIAQATRDYLEPRRNGPEGVFYGAAVNQLTDNLWMLAGHGDDPLRWHFTPDQQLLTGIAVDGLLPNPRQDENKVWQWWLAMRERLDERGGKLLEKSDVLELAQLHQVELIRLLGPDDPLPREWATALPQLADELPQSRTNITDTFL